MQLAILHYHLNSGGVARVVQNHLLALAQASSPTAVERVLLVHGGRAAGWPQKELDGQLPFRVETVAIDGLDYDQDGTAATEQLARSIETALRAAGCTPDTTLLHWHNHSLGKNVSAPLAVRRLASLGYRTLLQIHDFAEDFRPDNYRRLAKALAEDDVNQLPSILYPQAGHIFYAALNRRDYRVLSQAGVDDDRLHLLPNPVSAPQIFSDARQARQLVGDTLGLEASERLATYPVRGIRRKNLGEMLLWSAVAQDTRFLVTLAPKNPAERASFDRWQKFAAEACLPCRFGTPAPLDFGHLLAASDVLLTTSVAEGFGMTFLEAWLVDRRLLGRNLPEITADFQQKGLDLNEMYDELPVPTEWVDRGQFLERMGAVIKSTYRAFGVALPLAADLQRQLSCFLDAETIDFARLPAKVQVGVIRRAQTSRCDRQQLLALNPKLELPDHLNKQQIEANAAIVRKHYSLVAIGEHLADVYASVMKSNPHSEFTSLAHGQAVFDSFLKVDRLHVVRVEP